MKFKPIVIVAIVSGLVWFGYHSFYGTDAKKNNTQAIKVSVADVVRKDVPISIALSGNVIAYESVNIKSRIDSQVVKVTFKDGEKVTAGQELFLLDDRSLKAQLKQLEATVQKEKSQLENTRLQYERAKNLIEKKFISQSQLDDAKAAYNSQLAIANAAQANLENTKILLSYTTITSPINGRAGTINVTQGNNVKANDTVAMVVINQVSPIRSQFSIPERYYEKVRAAINDGIVVNAFREDNQEPVQGKLEYIDNTINPETGSFIARAVFTNEQEQLWPGMFVKISLELGIEKNKLTIPLVAVQGDEGKHFVFKIVDDKAVKTPVTVEQRVDNLAIVESGINENDKIITDGLLRISDGSTVEINTVKDSANSN